MNNSLITGSFVVVAVSGCWRKEQGSVAAISALFKLHIS